MRIEHLPGWPENLAEQIEFARREAEVAESAAQGAERDHERHLPGFPPKLHLVLRDAANGAWAQVERLRAEVDG